jgi:MoxR-like ATPase
MYERRFDPAASPGRDPVVTPTRRDAEVYLFGKEVVLAVNVALATTRPLLVFGPPGSGKSALAPNVARILGWRVYSEVVTSATEAQDLLWKVDAVRRLADSQIKDLGDMDDYLTPGVLWWAFDPDTARRVGRRTAAHASPWRNQQGPSAVVLLDEIDKADPDVPNNLLVPLDARTFPIPGATVQVTEENAPLIVITTNDERDLPRAFVRRCVVLSLTLPTVDDLVSIGEAHLGKRPGDLFRQAAELLVEAREEARSRGEPGPSTAEYLDFLRACLVLGIDVGGEEWRAVANATIAKSVDPSGMTR